MALQLLTFNLKHMSRSDHIYIYISIYIIDYHYMWAVTYQAAVVLS